MTLFEEFDYYKRLINVSYGDNTSIYSKGKVLRKFGRNEDLQTGVTEMLWTYGGIETLAVGNTINTVSSSNTGDTQAVTIEGHTIDGDGNLTFSIQTVTLNGQNKVVLGTPLARATRMYNVGSTDFLGNIFIYEDDTIVAGVPQTPAKVHMEATIGNNQSLKAATSISSSDYWCINRVVCSVEKSQTAVVDFKVQVKLKGQVWRTILFATVSGNTGTIELNLDNTPIIIPPNSDVRVLGTSTTNTVLAGAELSGYLAIKL